jgi:hypothetical protein
MAAMRKLTLVSLLLSLSCAIAIPAHASWGFVQHVCKTNCPSGTQCIIGAGDGLATTGAGHLGEVHIINDLGLNDTQITSVSGGGTYTHCASCHATLSNNSVDASYTTASASGDTTITVNLTASLANANWTACYNERSSTLGTITLNTGGTPSCAVAQSVAAAPTGCALTLSANNGVIITVFQSNTTTITGVSAPFGNSLQPNGNGSADNENTTSGSAVAWTPTTNDTGVKMAIAFEETSGGGGTAPTRTLMHVGK